MVPVMRRPIGTSYSSRQRSAVDRPCWLWKAGAIRRRSISRQGDNHRLASNPVCEKGLLILNSAWAAAKQSPPDTPGSRAASVGQTAQVQDSQSSKTLSGKTAMQRRIAMLVTGRPIPAQAEPLRFHESVANSLIAQVPSGSA